MTACFSLGDSENKPMQDRLGRPGSHLEEAPRQGQLIRHRGQRSARGGAIAARSSGRFPRPWPRSRQGVKVPAQLPGPATRQRVAMKQTVVVVGSTVPSCTEKPDHTDVFLSCGW